jgi:hypothetical protein
VDPADDEAAGEQAPICPYEAQDAPHRWSALGNVAEARAQVVQGGADLSHLPADTFGELAPVSATDL